MRMILCQQAVEAVPQFTGGWFHLQSEGDAVYLVDARTGGRLQILTSDLAETGDAQTPEALTTGPDPSTDGTFPTVDEKIAAIGKLSKREYAVFSMIGVGMDMCEIATRLGISIKTVETYRARLKQKLEIDNRTKLLFVAVEWTLRGRQGDARPTDPDKTVENGRHNPAHASGRPASSA